MWLVGDFSDWKISSDFQARRISDKGEWELRIAAGLLKHGQHYRVEMKWPGGGGQRLPAWGRKTWQDAQTLEFTAQVWWPDVAYSWQHQSPPRKRFLRIYEAHPGMASEEPKVAGWAEFRDAVLPQIAAGGYDTIQLMAVMEHPYYGSFGYHVGSFFAPSFRFGTPEELKSLVDAAHGLGLRVIMDLVHSHAVKNEVEGLSRYDGSDHQFFHHGPRGNHDAWDSRCFDYAKPRALHFLLSNLRYWLEEFHFDGFRFDGVTSMLYLDHGLGLEISSYGDYFGANIDEDAVIFLGLANRLIHLYAEDTLSVAEDVSGMPGLAACQEDGGIGFDYRLAMGLPECWWKLIKKVPDEQWSMQQLWYELRNHRADEMAISYVESHDQAMVGGKSFIFEMIDAAMYDSMHLGSQSLIVERGVALHKMARLATLASAGHGYLNFMGNEFGHPEWIDFPRAGNDWSCAKARRQWNLRDNPNLRFQGLAKFDRAILALVEDDWPDRPPWLIKADDGDKILAIKRGVLVLVFNFHPERSYEAYGVSVAPGEYALQLCSDEARFGGMGRVEVPQVATAAQIGPEAFLQMYLPSRTVTVWKKTIGKA